MRHLADALLALAGIVVADRILAGFAPKPKGWDVHDLPRHVHVVPVGDHIDHDLDSLDCICGPAVEFHERPLVTHASLDGREVHA